jgi:hypothetical protein
MLIQDEPVHEALAILERLASDPSTHPPVVVLPAEGGGSIKGNENGLVKLAYLALKASRGEEQKFQEKWIVQDELAGTIDGISLDVYAHYDLPQKHTRWQTIKSSTIFIAVVVIVTSIFVTGMVAASHWFWGLVTHKR